MIDLRPSVAGTPVVTIRNPNLGEKIVHDNLAIVRRTPGGTPIVFRDTDWVLEQVLSFQFNNLTLININALKTLLSGSPGLRMQMTDYESATVYGYILTPVFNIAQQHDTCTHSFNFDFMIDGYTVSTNFDILTQASDTLDTESGNILEVEH